MNKYPDHDYETVYKNSIVTGFPGSVGNRCRRCGWNNIGSTPFALQQHQFESLTPPNMKWESYGDDKFVFGWRLVPK